MHTKNFLNLPVLALDQSPNQAPTLKKIQNKFFKEKRKNRFFNLQNNYITFKTDPMKKFLNSSPTHNKLLPEKTT